MIPPETRLGQPDPTAQGQPIAVRTFYMVGDHDWFFHLPGPSLDALREKVIGGLGLANRPGEPFPHDMQENEDLLRTMRRHKVTARHGDLYDPLSFDGDRDASSVSDALVIELVNRFSAEMEARLAGELPASAVLGLREINNVRPLVLIPVWLEGLLERTCTQPAMRKKVKTIWDQLVDDFLAIDFLRQRDSAGQLIDGLAAALKFSRRPSTGWAAADGRLVPWTSRLGRPVLRPAGTGRAGLPQPAIEADRLRAHPRRRVRTAGRQLRRDLCAQPGLLQCGHLAEGPSPDAAGRRAARVCGRRRDDLPGLLPRRRAAGPSLRDLVGHIRTSTGRSDGPSHRSRRGHCRPSRSRLRPPPPASARLTFPYRRSGPGSCPAGGRKREWSSGQWPVGECQWSGTMLAWDL